MRHIRCGEGCGRGGYGKRRIMPEGSGHDAASHTDARRACTIESKF